jgi:hypothetical protein
MFSEGQIPDNGETPETLLSRLQRLKSAPIETEPTQPVSPEKHVPTGVNDLDIGDTIKLDGTPSQATIIPDGETGDFDKGLVTKRYFVAAFNSMSSEEQEIIKKKNNWI